MHASGDQIRTAGQVRGADAHRFPAVRPAVFGADRRIHSQIRDRAAAQLLYAPAASPMPVQHMAVTRGGGGGRRSGAVRSQRSGCRTEQNGASGGWRRFREPAQPQGGARTWRSERGIAAEHAAFAGFKAAGRGVASVRLRAAGTRSPAVARHPVVRRGRVDLGIRPESMRIAPQVMHERPGAPRQTRRGPRQATALRVDRLRVIAPCGPAVVGPASGGGHSGGGGRRR